MAIKFTNVDILKTLHAILLANTQHYRDDFYQFDIQYFWKRMNAGTDYDRKLLWLSRPNGTNCLREHDVFVAGSSHHYLWRYYQEYDNARNLAFFVELKDVVNGRLFGDVYELKYAEHYNRVVKESVSGRALIKYSKGEVLQEFKTRIPPIHPQFGALVEYEPVPYHDYELDDVLFGEKVLRTKNRAGTIERYILQIGKRKKERK